MELASAVRDFEEAASDYVALLDRARDLPRDEFLRGSLELLCRLVVTALRLPPDDSVPIALTDDEGDDVERLLETGVEDLLGPAGAYWALPPTIGPDDSDLNPPIAVGSLAEDLAEIYGAVMPGLLAARRGDAAVAAATWHFGFWSHWGEHALEATRAILAILYAVHRKR